MNWIGRRLRDLRWADRVAPIWLLATAGYWIAAVTIPYYALRLHTLDRRLLFGDAASPRLYYHNVMGMIFANLTLLVWGVFYFGLPLLPWSAAAVGFVRTRKSWILLSLIVTLVMYVHLVANLWVGWWPDGDAAWAFEVVHHI